VVQPRTQLPGHIVFKHLFVPALIGVSVWSWLRHEVAEDYLRTARWGIDLTTAALLSSIAIIWLAEQLYPSNPDSNYRIAAHPVRGLNRLGRDLFYLTIGSLVNGIATGFLASKCAALTARLGHGLDRATVLWPASLPFAARVALAFVLIELFSYWYHRAAHRFAVLWGFHSTHHVITEVTGLKALRTHPVDNALFYLPRTLPLMFLGVGAQELVAATYFGCILGILSHANVDVNAVGLGWFMNLPRYHLVHHSSLLEESNSNFGCHTVLWDRIFGTFRASKGQAPIGVVPVQVRTLWQELIWPLYRSVEVLDARPGFIP
jgi:sterol desaturase/sphingolipid hydroxylase (fatty acid hydroxylase superfamily)